MPLVPKMSSKSLSELLRDGYKHRGKALQRSPPSRAERHLDCSISHQLGYLFPRPGGYADYAGSPKRFAFPVGEGLRIGVCVFSVQVFCARLDAREIQQLRGGELMGPLTKLFQEYRGWHSIRLGWGCRGSSDSFPGFR